MTERIINNTNLFFNTIQVITRAENNTTARYSWFPKDTIRYGKTDQYKSGSTAFPQSSNNSQALETWSFLYSHVKQDLKKWACKGLCQLAKIVKYVLALKLSLYQTEKPHSDFRGHWDKGVMNRVLNIPVSFPNEQILSMLHKPPAMQYVKQILCAVLQPK